MYGIANILKAGGQLVITDSKGASYTVEYINNYFRLAYSINDKICHLNFMSFDEAVQYTSGVMHHE